MLVFCFDCCEPNANGQKDLDFRTLPMQKNGIKEQLGLMPLECYKCQRATRPHAFRMLNVEDELK